MSPNTKMCAFVNIIELSMLKFHVYRKINIDALGYVIPMHENNREGFIAPLSYRNVFYDRTRTKGELFITSNNVYVSLVSRKSNTVYLKRIFGYDGYCQSLEDAVCN